MKRVMALVLIMGSSFAGGRAAGYLLCDGHAIWFGIAVALSSPLACLGGMLARMASEDDVRRLVRELRHDLSS